MCRFGMKRPNDPPLYARSVTRLRQGLYAIVLYHASGRKYGVERFVATSMEHAMERCRRLYPSTVDDRRHK